MVSFRSEYVPNNIISSFYEQRCIAYIDQQQSIGPMEEDNYFTPLLENVYIFMPLTHLHYTQ